MHLKSQTDGVCWVLGEGGGGRGGGHFEMSMVLYRYVSVEFKL